MQPTEPNGQRADGFKPKWRHFHPMDRIWVQNPFNEDIVFQVADEYNRPFKYRLQAGKVSELPGGAIATLGVKQIVDRLIQDTSGDEMQMWNENIRRKHEKNIILREKRANIATSADKPGEIDLSVKSDEVAAPAQEEQTAPEEAFPGLNQPKDEVQLTPLPPAAAGGLNDLVSASLPANDAIIEE